MFLLIFRTLAFPRIVSFLREEEEQVAITDGEQFDLFDLSCNNILKEKVKFKISEGLKEISNVSVGLDNSLWLCLEDTCSVRKI